MTNWEGVFPLWKEAGMTSHDCVSQARKLFRMKRIGHTGTLDPEVPGVLPLCLGRATRLVEYLQDQPKTYEAVMTIGYATDTEDESGTVVERAERVDVSEADVAGALDGFIGTVRQVPPMYSAVKVKGKRLYELARAGMTVERKPREVQIHNIELTGFHPDVPYPRASLRITCSKGTYIRTLCADIGRKLGYPAVMSGLVRIAAGSIRAEQCVTFREAEALAERGELAGKIIPTGEAVSFMPKAVVSDHALKAALKGSRLFARAVRPVEPGATERGNRRTLYRLHAREEDRFIGIYSHDPESDLFIPVKLFV